MRLASAAAFGITFNLALLGTILWTTSDDGRGNPVSEYLRIVAVFRFVPSVLLLSWLEYYIALAILGTILGLQKLVHSGTLTTGTNPLWAL